MICVGTDGKLHEYKGRRWGALNPPPAALCGTPVAQDERFVFLELSEVHSRKACEECLEITRKKGVA